MMAKYLIAALLGLAGVLGLEWLLAAVVVNVLEGAADSALECPL